MNPMKVTAIVILILGVMIGGYATVCLAASGHDATGGNPPADSPLMSNPWVLFPFAAAALLGGASMLMFGGKGVINTRNPAVRR